MRRGKKRGTSDLFGDEIAFAGIRPPDPHPEKVLAFLREGPKHRDWLRIHVPDPAAVVETLRTRGHVVKAVKYFGRTDWVYALSENGRICGVEGKAGEDSDEAVA